MFSFLFGSKKISEKVIIGVGPSFVLFVSNLGKQRFVKKDVVDNSDRANAIKTYISEVALGKKIDVSVVFLNGMYREIQIDKPKVSEEELLGAIPWAIKDFVQESVNNLAIDYIDMPKSPTYPNDKIMAVAVNKELLKSIIDSIKGLGTISVITSENIAMIDLISNTDEDKPHLVLFQPNGYELSLLVVWHSRLFMIRNIRGFSDLPKYLLGALPVDVLDGLSLELQRSIDFMVSQLKIPQPQFLTVAIDSQERAKITDYLTQTFSLSANASIDNDISVSASFLPLVALLNKKDESK